MNEVIAIQRRLTRRNLGILESRGQNDKGSSISSLSVRNDENDVSYKSLGDRRILSREVLIKRALDYERQKEVENIRENYFGYLKNSTNTLIDTRYGNVALPLNGTDLNDPSKLRGSTVIASQTLYPDEELERRDKYCNSIRYSFAKR